MINFTAWAIKTFSGWDLTWQPGCFFARIEFLLKCLQTKARGENVSMSWHLCCVAILSKGQPCQKRLASLAKRKSCITALAPHEEDWKSIEMLTRKAVLCSTLASWSKDTDNQLAVQDCIINMELDLWTKYICLNTEGHLTLARFFKCLQLSVWGIKV